MLNVVIIQKTPKNEQSIIAEFMDLSELPNFLIEQKVTNLDFNDYLSPKPMIKDIIDSFNLFSELTVSIFSHTPIEEMHFDDSISVKIYKNGTGIKEQKYKSVW